MPHPYRPSLELMAAKLTERQRVREADAALRRTRRQELVLPPDPPKPEDAKPEEESQ